MGLGGRRGHGGRLSMGKPGATLRGGDRECGDFRARGVISARLQANSGDAALPLELGDFPVFSTARDPSILVAGIGTIDRSASAVAHQRSDQCCHGTERIGVHSLLGDVPMPLAAIRKPERIRRLRRLPRTGRN